MGKGDFSFDEFCRVISEFSSCMDDYPYVIDLKNDKYFMQRILKNYRQEKRIYIILNTDGLTKKNALSG